MGTVSDQIWLLKTFFVGLLKIHTACPPNFMILSEIGFRDRIFKIVWLDKFAFDGPWRCLKGRFKPKQQAPCDFLGIAS